MLVSYRWLQDYIDLSDMTPSEVAEKLTRGGVEVDILHELNQGVENVVIGSVTSCEQHPNADKLNLCQVKIGEEVSQIVCGAPNVAAGQKVAVAKPGAKLPGGVKIKRTKLRGESSEGMICSLQELGVEPKLVAKEFADGIFVFPQEVEEGADALEALSLNDTVLELDLTPNRADCLSMIGVAYEMAALLDRQVKLPDTTHHEDEEKTSNFVSVEVENGEDNPYYGAKVIKDVTISPSPLWLQNRLVAAGIRPINNVVDITNFVLLEYGQPLHAFDYDRFGSSEIVVRRAKEGEKITTLDEEERTLSPDHLVITNGKEATALAGVMGGAFSEVTSETKTVLLEAAYFNPSLVRKASRDHSLRSESSSRFEKGIDLFRVEQAAERAAKLMEDLAGGKVLEGTVEKDSRDKSKPVITTTVTRINSLLGMELSQSDMIDIFRRLRLDVTEQEHSLEVSIPSRRPDLRIEEDLVEEVARLYGYDYIPTTLPAGATTPGSLTDYQAKRRQIRRYLESSGLHETINYSLTSPEKVNRFATEKTEHTVNVSMPMSEERSVMRTSLLPHIIDAIQYNHNRQLHNAAIFEVGSIFLTDQKQLAEQPEEKEMLAGAITGLWETHMWQGEKKEVDFYVLKGILEGMFEELGLENEISFKPLKLEDMHPGRTAEILLGGEHAGFIGQVHPSLKKLYDIKETYVFQVNLQFILSFKGENLRYQTLPRYPSIGRDIALVLNEDIPAGEVKAVIRKAGGSLLRKVNLFDLYQGEHMEEGKKSLAFSLLYLDPERTLTDEEVTKVHEHVLEELKSNVGAVLRA
ncbi:phenylalanine--tRNA ligase subunit beta [Thalassorhabdus alkalitolerans]|uniref:Phenylalanine--tRNA ligase beta subunit n=1 Tax=Thalassorhabdus alkalitolerans TaxID=2282697 RepID=A0ABW0YQS7_9BACI